MVASLMMVGAIAAVPAFAASGSDKADEAVVEAAPEAAAAETEEVKPLPATNEWYEATDCSQCHSKQIEAMEKEDSPCISAVHSKFLSCSNCHNVDELAPIHETVTEKSKAPSALKKTSIDVKAVCYQCHDTEKLAEATKDSTVLTDDNGTVVNPHAIPSNDRHDAEISCVDCHKGHSKTALEKTASRACTSCHHAMVYECGTCHAA